MLRLSLRSYALLTLGMCVAVLFGLTFFTQSVYAQTDSYDMFVINSPLNTSLRITATPLELDNATGQWTYRIDWKRVRNAQGSLYITKESNSSTVILSLSPAAQSGSKTVTLAPNTTYRVKFYGAPAKGGVLILSKRFTTLTTADENPDIDAEYDSNTVGTGTGTGTATPVITTGTGSGSYDPAVDNKTTNTFYIAPGMKTKDSSDPVYFVARIGNTGGVSGFPAEAKSLTLKVKNLPLGMNVKFFTVLSFSRGSNEGFGLDTSSVYKGDVPTSFIPGTDLTRVSFDLWNQLSPNPGATVEDPLIPHLFDDYLVRPASEYSTTVTPGSLVIMQIDTNASFTSGPGVYQLKGVLTYEPNMWSKQLYTEKEVSFAVTIPNDQLSKCLTALSNKTKYPAPFQKDVSEKSTFPNISSDVNTLFASFGNGTDVYYDNESGVWRKTSTNITDPPKACDKLIAVDVTSPSTIYKYSDGTYRDQHRVWITEGETVDIKVVAPPSVKTATLYLMKESNSGGNATEANMGLMGLGSLAGGATINPDDIKNDNIGSQTKGTRAGRQWRSGEVDASKYQLIPTLHPQAATAIGTITLSNGKGSIKWTVPRMDPLVDTEIGNNPFASKQESIRIVADNGIWSDSPHFSVVTNNQSCGSSGLMGACDRSKVTRVTGGLNKDTIIDKQTPTTYLARSFGQSNAPSILWVVPAWVGIDKANDDFVKADLNQSWVVKPGDQMKVYAYQYNVGDISEVSLELMDYTSNCKYDYSTLAQDNSTCEINFRSQTDDNDRKKWIIAPSVRTGFTRVIDPKTNFWKWTFEYTFTLPNDVPSGRYIVRMIDPAYAYNYLNRPYGSKVYPGVGAKYSNYVIVGGTSPATVSATVAIDPVVTSSPTPVVVTGTVQNPSGVGGLPDANICGRVAIWWFRNAASGFNVYRNTTNSVSTAQQIQANGAYTDATYGGYVDSRPTGGTYYYWVENVGGSTKVPLSNNATGGLVASVCK